MKHLLLSVLLHFCAGAMLFAQNKLSGSSTSGAYTYIYRLTDKEAFYIASTAKPGLNDGFLHTRIDSFYNARGAGYAKKLPYGNYLYIKAIKNELFYRLVPENNVNLQFINNRKDFQFTVTDLKGNLVADARVKAGKNKAIKYDDQAKLYIAGSGAKQAVITVLHEGINNYFSYEEEEKYKPLYRRSNTGKRSGYAGYMVFNKPMYKPLDTVKFKAYLVTDKGKAMQHRPLQVVLHRNGAPLILTTLKPYRTGGYEYSFVLADSLQLKLDRNYNIGLKQQRKKEWETVYQGSFRYEDYELKSVNFSVRTDKQTHSPGSPVTVFMKATDENELAVPDGRVEVVISADNASNFYDRQVFVKDSLWKKDIVLDPVGETKLVVPDSIFPKADINFSMSFTFLNSNNERRTAFRSLKYLVKNQQIRYVFKKDSLRLDYLQKGESVKQKAVVLISYPHSDQRDSLQIELPAALKMNYRVSGYQIKTSDGYHQYISLEDLKPDINISATQNKDSLEIVVGNVHKIPFWYTVFSGDKVFLRGYGTNLDTVLRHTRAKAAHIRLDYIWDESVQSTETSAFYRPNVLNVKLLAPDLVYPGQTVRMQVKVTDVNNRPVAATDVTAFAYTSKFKNGYNAGIPGFGKRFRARQFNPKLEAAELSLSGQMKLAWDKWGRELQLDTMEYYRFTQPKELYVIQEGANAPNTTAVAPFVVKDGAIVPAHVVYIDEVPVYFSQANQVQRYAFKISPGKHSIRMRTAGYMVILDDYDFVKGKKTIISVAADLKNSKANVSPAPAELTADESSLLAKYMIRIANNFKGEKTVIATDSARYLLNLPDIYDNNAAQVRLPEGYLKKTNPNTSLLVGPFAENYLGFESGTRSQTFFKEPGYTYTFLPGLLKQKSYDTPYGFSTMLYAGVAGGDDYKQQPFKKGEVDSIWNEYLDLRSSVSMLFNNRYRYGKAYGRLIMKLDSSISKQMPYLKNVIIYKYDELDFLQIYPGNTNNFNALEQSKYRMLYLFKDNRYFIVEPVFVKAGGLNYFEWKDVKIKPADSLSRKIDQQIKSVNTGRSGTSSIEAQQAILQKINEKYFNPGILKGKMSGRVIDGTRKEPLAGVAVKIKGANYGTTTGMDGRFEIKVPERGKLVVMFIGYNSKETPVINGYAGDIMLSAATAALDEVVVVGYGAQKKADLSGSVQTLAADAFQGRLAGVNANSTPAASYNLMIRGNSTSPANQKPLVIIDGLPFNGDINTLDAATVASMDILKDSDATAIYGARAAAGVIIIKTKNGATALNAAGELVQQQQTMRSNFSDYAIWEPKLFTDAEGRASFTVKFPDDITSWATKLIAMNSRKQGGVAETSIRSFKTLSANFVAPLFALAGDSIRVIGKLMNYSHADETVNRKFSYNGATLLNSAVTFKNAKIDTVAIVASGFKDRLADSLKFEYTMKQDNGYFDGEIRKIPLLYAGVTETKGFFNALTRDTSITYKFDPALGKVTLRAEASLFPALLDEMEKLRNYEYLCNEQLASKLKALLLEKSVRKYLGEDFKEEKNINALLKKLQNNKRPEGTWGWWQNSSEELWISLHVVETLLQAQKQGYAVVLDKDKLYNYLVGKLAGEQHFDQIHGVKLLNMLNEKYYINDWITAIEKQSAIPLLVKRPLYEKLQLMQLRQKAGMPVDLKWLLDQKKETMFGNSYWGEPGNHFWDNDIQNTLLAYQILKANGGYRDELDRIQRYFLAQRADGQWRNTYESSLILQTILPELMTSAGKRPEPASISLNQAETVTVFPFNKVMEPAILTVQKKGDAPVYFTAYQQFNNPEPKKVSKDFAVKTSFEQKGTAVTKLKAGILTNLKIEVDVRADADYVMIEVPIPAGCSYENKMQHFWGVETHREYFKHKTSIFCSKLKKGKYIFSIQLMPRYSGSYQLNPARAEMMYFPVFYGREGMKRVTIN